MARLLLRSVACCLLVFGLSAATFALDNEDPPTTSAGPSLPADPAGESLSALPEPQTLDEAIAQVRELDQAGIPRGEIAAWLSGVLDRRVTNLNSPERMGLLENWRPWPFTEVLPSPKQDAFTEWNKQQEYRPGPTAQWTWENQVGQCSEHAGTAYHILQEAGVSGSPRIVAAPNHEFVVWGMQEGANPNDPSTWGPDAYVVDGWMGSSFTPDEITSNSYFKNGEEDRQLNDVTTSFDETATRWDISDDARRSSTSDADCFIASAAYGTPLAAEVQVLRAFRDGHLRESERGRAFVRWYENVGPGLARWVEHSPEAQSFTRTTIVSPAVWAAEHLRPLWEPDAPEPLSSIERLR